MDVEHADHYSSWKLKHKIRNKYGDKIVFIERSGLSDLVCTSSMTVGDALKKSARLEENADFIEYPDISTSTKQSDERKILHNAAAIIRNAMLHIKDTEKCISSFDINTTVCADYVPDILYDFVMWCVNIKAADDASSCLDGAMKKDNLKILNICHNLISQAQKVRSSITLGLAIRVHHDFGSKKLIDDLHALGISVPYDEIRQFLTSVAIDQKTDDIYVPRGIRNYSNTLIDAAIDNFNKNEETLDGKSTTHAMAAVLYKRCAIDSMDCIIPRLCKKSMSATDIFRTNEQVER